MILVDTHALLWFLAGDDALSTAARRAIEDNERVCVSIASLWEIAIKIAANKLTVGQGFDGLVADLLDNDIEVLRERIRGLRSRSRCRATRERRTTQTADAGVCELG